MSDRATISTHVLDTALGTPAPNVPVVFEHIDGSGIFTELHRGVTDADGRIPRFASAELPLKEGSYRLRFEVAGYFASTNRASFYTEITVAFEIGEEAQHYHVPLLLSPFGYSTYRGS